MQSNEQEDITLNRSTQLYFTHIQDAVSKYQKNVTDILTTYRAAKQKATAEKDKYKDSAGFYQETMNAAKTAARASIQYEREQLQEAVQDEIDNLQRALVAQMVIKPQATFSDLLAVYQTFNIQPSRAEIQELMSKNCGNSLGLRALNSVLEQTKAPYRIKTLDAAAYEKDLRELRALIREDMLWAPSELSPENHEIFAGTKRPSYKSDGTPFDTGRTWSSPMDAVAIQRFENIVSELGDMSSRWAESFTPSLDELKERYEPVEDENGDTITAEQQFVADTKATAAAATVEDASRPDLAWGQRKAAQDNQAAATYKKAMEEYGR